MVAKWGKMSLEQREMIGNCMGTGKRAGAWWQNRARWGKGGVGNSPFPLKRQLGLQNQGLGQMGTAAVPVNVAAHRQARHGAPRAGVAGGKGARAGTGAMCRGAGGRHQNSGRQWQAGTL